VYRVSPQNCATIMVEELKQSSHFMNAARPGADNVKEGVLRIVRGASFALPYAAARDVRVYAAGLKTSIRAKDKHAPCKTVAEQV
jgi:hypothetical protein